MVVDDFFRTKSTKFCRDGIHPVHGKWKKLVENNGNYFVQVNNFSFAVILFLLEAKLCCKIYDSAYYNPKPPIFPLKDRLPKAVTVKCNGL